MWIVDFIIFIGAAIVTYFTFKYAWQVIKKETLPEEEKEDKE